MFFRWIRTSAISFKLTCIAANTIMGDFFKYAGKQVSTISIPNASKSISDIYSPLPVIFISASNYFCTVVKKTVPPISRCIKPYFLFFPSEFYKDTIISFRYWTTFYVRENYCVWKTTDEHLRLQEPLIGWDLWLEGSMTIGPRARDKRLLPLQGLQSWFKELYVVKHCWN